MNTRRHRYENNVPVRALSPWLLVLVLVALGGFTWVYYKNQLIHRGASIRAMEKKLVELGRANEALRGKIAQLSTISKLEERQRAGVIKMVKIAPENIVYVRFPVRDVAEIETNSNPVARR